MPRGADFDQDPLSMLRALAAAAASGVDLDPEVLSAMRNRRALLRKPAARAVREAFLALLAVPGCSRQLAVMDECRLLAVLFPELEPCRRCAVEYYGPGGVMTHTLSALSRADFLFAHLPRVFPDLADSIAEHLGGAAEAGGRRARLMLTVLLHDVAKPATARRIKGRLRFFGHDAKGASEAAAVMRRLKFPAADVADAEAVIAHHLRPGNLAAGGRVTDRAANRFFRDTGKHAVDLLLCAWADHASYLDADRLEECLPVLRKAAGNAGEFLAPKGMAEDAAKTLRHLWTIGVLLSRRFSQPEAKPAPLLNGNDVMKALGLVPGPEVGKVLGKLALAQSRGKLKDRRAALAFIDRFKT